MRANHVKQKVGTGGISIGTFVFEFNTTGIGRLAAQAGAEFAVCVLDMGAMGIMAPMVESAAQAARLVPAGSYAGRCHLVTKMRAAFALNRTTKGLARGNAQRGYILFSVGAMLGTQQITSRISTEIAPRKG